MENLQYLNRMKNFSLWPEPKCDKGQDFRTLFYPLFKNR